MGTPGTQTQGPRAAVDAAQDEGKQLAQSAADATTQVAETVKEEVSAVAGDVSTQVHSLVGQASDEVRGQVDQQRSRAARALRTTGDEFASLAGKGQYSQLTSLLTRRAAEQARSVADYLEHTSPAEIIDQVRSFARRRPGAFLLSAALAGAVGGRLLKSVATGDGETTSTSASSTTYRPTGPGLAEPLPPAPPVPVGAMPPGGTAATGTVPPQIVVEEVVAEPVTPGPGTAGRQVTDAGASGRGDTPPREDLLP